MQTPLDSIPDSLPQNTLVQPGKHIIKLNVSTKIVYSLFNFFAPVFIVTIGFAGGIAEGEASIALFAILLSAVVGLVCMIVNLVKYNRFLCVEGAFIHICKGKKEAPKVLESLPLEALQKQLGDAPVVQYNGKKKKLLHTSLSIVGQICWVGPLLIIFVLHSKSLARGKMAEIYALMPQLFAKEIKAPSQAESVILNILLWGFTLLAALIGLGGVFFILSFLLFLVTGG